MKNPRGGSEKLSSQGSLAKSARAIQQKRREQFEDRRPGEGRDPYTVTARCEEGPVVRSRFNYCGRGLWVPAPDAQLRIWAGTTSYRLALACSAELCAASASCAEISAVCAADPQLGVSLPSPQARGR